MELEKVELEEFELENMTALEARGTIMVVADLTWAYNGPHRKIRAMELDNETELRHSHALGVNGLQFVGDNGHLELLGHEIGAVYKTTVDNLLGHCYDNEKEDFYWVLIKE